LGLYIYYEYDGIFESFGLVDGRDCDRIRPLQDIFGGNVVPSFGCVIEEI
jgi:hypothetical protein